MDGRGQYIAARLATLESVELSASRRDVDPALLLEEIRLVLALGPTGGGAAGENRGLMNGQKNVVRLDRFRKARVRRRGLGKSGNIFALLFAFIRLARAQERRIVQLEGLCDTLAREVDTLYGVESSPKRYRLAAGPAHGRTPLERILFAGIRREGKGA